MAARRPFVDMVASSGDRTAEVQLASTFATFAGLCRMLRLALVCSRRGPPLAWQVT